MKNKLLFFAFFICCAGFTQNTVDDKAELYKNYREDQFYASVTYNLLNLKPSGVTQSGFSSGFHLGFIRDMPINERRNIALGLGLGVSANTYNQNISIESSSNELLYNIIDESEINVSKNKFATYVVEIPFEIRWRTSTSESYNFWRIYTGFKLGYVLHNFSRFKSSVGNEKLSNISDINKLQYGLTLSAGYGTWNFHVYYGLNTIFDDSAILEGEAIGLKSLKFGLIFYIL